VLLPLIKQDLADGKEAAEQAGLPYYRAAGEKLLEAKAQLQHGEFLPWLTRNFHLTSRTASTYMKLAEALHGQKGNALPFSSLGDFLRKTGPNPNYNTFASKKPAWQESVKQVVNRVDTATLNRARDDLKRAEEREAQRKLGPQPIDAARGPPPRTTRVLKRSGQRPH
jgi:hypothetical protein